MASKLRRAPLFGIDNPLRIPSLPKYSSPATPLPTGYKFTKAPAPTSTAPVATPLPPKHSTTAANKTQNIQVSKPALQNGKSTVDDSVQTCVPEKKKSESVSTESKPTAAKASAAMQLKVAHNRHSKSVMEVGVAYTGDQRAPPRGVVAPSPDRGRGSPKSSLHVDFAAPGEMKERKEKYLTAKYGAHQMALIRKRLGVEMWMYDQLQTLYPSKPDSTNDEKEVDLDELLDLDDDAKRRKFLREHLSDCTFPSEDVEKFIGELLERAKIL